MRNEMFGSINIGQNYKQEARQHSVLTLDQIEKGWPTVMATAAHSSRSSRYVHIPTYDVIAGLQEQGFLPVHVQMARTRDEDKQGHAKHIVRFRHKDNLEDVRVHADWRNREWFEIIMKNAHDGTAGYVMCAGWFRPTCLNGMAYGEKTAEVRVPHKGKDCLQRVVEGAFKVLEQKDRVKESRDLMAETVLTDAEQAAYAVAMTNIRYAQSHVAQGIMPPVDPSRVLGHVRRVEDQGSDLWRVFMRCQENLTQGGLRTNDPTRRSHTRPITGTADHLANQAMWQFTQMLAQAKAA